MSSWHWKRGTNHYKEPENHRVFSTVKRRIIQLNTRNIPQNYHNSTLLQRSKQSQCGKAPQKGHLILTDLLKNNKNIPTLQFSFGLAIKYLFLNCIWRRILETESFCYLSVVETVKLFPLESRNCGSKNKNWLKMEQKKRKSTCENRCFGRFVPLTS